jgi:hypothetical protein
MAGTIAFGSLYPGASASTQQTVNAGGSAKVPTRNDFDVPVLSGVAGAFGISVPILIAIGVLALFLIEKYD